MSLSTLQIGTAVSLAAFVFSGDLERGLGRAVMSFMLGSVIHGGHWLAAAPMRTVGHD